MCCISSKKKKKNKHQNGNSLIINTLIEQNEQLRIQIKQLKHFQEELMYQNKALMNKINKLNKSNKSNNSNKQMKTKKYIFLKKPEWGSDSEYESNS